MSYPGGKGQSYRRLINLMPPHEIYIETHLGGGAVLSNKKPAPLSIGVDIDPDVIAKWNPTPSFRVHLGDAVDFLRTFRFSGEELVYADPPYVASTRRSERIYRYEYSDEQHLDLLQVLKQLPCAVMISGYKSNLYDRMLAGWRTVSFPSVTNAGTVANEWVWMNYPVPTELHDYSYLGASFRDRERIRRRHERWRRKLMALPAHERAALLEVLSEVSG